MTGDPDAPGQVGLIPGADGFVTWCICKITGSHCGHMIIRIDDHTVVSADGDLPTHRVTIRPAADFPNAVWSMFDLTAEQSARVTRFALAQVGKPYAYLDDALIGLERIFRFRFPDWVRARFSDNGQWQCAELADAALYAAGVRVFTDGRRIGDVYPGSYEQEFIKRGWYTAEYFRSFRLTWRPTST